MSIASATLPKIKPLLRGHIHQEAFFIALGACSLLVAKSTNKISLISSLIYSLGLLTLLGISALYHRVHWQPKPRALMRRLDHSAIFGLIAGTFTPVCALALSEKDGRRMLIVIWSAATLGILQANFWSTAPKWFAAIFYVVVGWLVLPYFSELKVSLGMQGLALLFAGGLVFTLGAVCYALKKPRLHPPIFGYHELFHLLTIVGAALHFIVVYQLIH